MMRAELDSRLLWMCLLTVFLILVASESQGDDKPPRPERIEAARDPRRISRVVKVAVRVVKPTAEFTPLEPIRLEVMARNVSDHEFFSLAMTGSFPYDHYRRFPIKVFDSKGLLVPRTRYGDFDIKWRGTPIGSGGGGTGSMFNSGMEDRGELIANLVFDMTSPGEYTILVEFRGGGYTRIDGVEAPIVAQSEPVKVKVLDRFP
jgi:hypothetical protein